MKKTLFNLMITGLAFTAITSCEDLNELCDLGEDDLVTGQYFVESYNELNHIAGVMDQAFRDSTINTDGASVIDGAMATKTTDSLIIDYGTIGVVCNDNKVRKGSIRSYLSQDYSQTNGKIKGTLKSYLVDDVVSTGTIELVNNGNGTFSPEINMNITNFNLEGQAQLDGSLTQQWLTGFGTFDLNDDAFNVLGNLGGSEANFNSAFTASIREDLKYRKSCEYEIEEGIIDLSLSGDSVKTSLISVDFMAADGCNNLFTVGTDCEGSKLSFVYPFN